MKCSSIWNSVPYKELFRLALEFCRVGRNILPLKTFDFEGVGTFYSMARAWVCAQPSARAVNRIFWHYLEDGVAGDRDSRAGLGHWDCSAAQESTKMP